MILKCEHMQFMDSLSFIHQAIFLQTNILSLKIFIWCLKSSLKFHQDYSYFPSFGKFNTSSNLRQALGLDFHHLMSNSYVQSSTCSSISKQRS
jgi:hypothetical protein